MPNGNVEATLVVAVINAFDPNEKLLFGAIAAMPLTNENCDFGDTGFVLAVTPFVTTLDWPQHTQFDFDASFRLRHTEHPQLLVAIPLNTSSTGGLTANDLDGNAPDAGFDGSVPLFTFTLLVAFGFGPA